MGEIEEGGKPRHRFMSSYEQKIEQPDTQYQYLLFAAEPYETIAFKVPNMEIDKSDKDKSFTHWDEKRKIFTMQVFLKSARTRTCRSSRRRRRASCPSPAAAEARGPSLCASCARRCGPGTLPWTGGCKTGARRWRAARPFSG